MTLFGIPRNPVPAGAHTGTFRSYDSLEIRYARWDPPRRGRKGTVCVFTGRAEFIEKYFETISDLRQRGFAVAIMDWRGQGGSSRVLRDARKGHVDSFAQYERDLELFMSDIILPDCPPPYFALAHSMGGNVLLRAACARDCWFERMVFSAPMIALGGKVPSLGIINAFSKTSVFFGLGDLYVPGGSDTLAGTEPYKGNLLTSDKRRYERNRMILDAAPNLGLGSPTIAWLCAAADTMKMVGAFGFPPHVKVPILMVAAGADKIVSNNAIDTLSMQLRAGSRIVLDGARHELLQEREDHREQFWAAFDAFIPGGC